MQITKIAAGIKLRPYQAALVADINAAWLSGAINVLAVLPTGGGKTATFSHIMGQFGGNSIAIAHRKELITQMAGALNRAGVPHRIIAPPETVKEIIAIQMEDDGYSMYNGNARAAVASVDTLNTTNSQKLHGQFLKSIGLWVTDEAHHLLKANKWGKAVAMFPTAKGLGVTATPVRADGYGLGAHDAGVFHKMVLGPTMRWLIDNGFLCDYYRPDGKISIACLPGVRREMFDDAVSETTGDYNLQKIRDILDNSQVVGNVVKEYQRHCPGGRGIVFSVDVQAAANQAKAFNDAGIPAEAVSAKTPPDVRRSIIKAFRDGRILILVNVDLFGEGFDVPACDVIIFVRPTESFSLYAQQFGRGARLAEGKKFFTIIDHVGNVIRHGGPPDLRNDWTLDGTRGSARNKTGEIPLKACAACTLPYKASLRACPWCGCKPEPASNTTPEAVEGDLALLDPSVLAELLEKARANARSDQEAMHDLRMANVPPIGHPMQLRAHQRNRESTRVLCENMALWSGLHGAKPLREQHAEFFYLFGVDYLTAQTLPSDRADALALNIFNDIQKRIAA